MAAKNETSDKVMSMVEKELAEHPDASVDDLYEKARKVDSGIADLTKRQFHARYPLQVKRRKSRSASGRKKKKKKTTSTRKSSTGGRSRTAAKKSTARSGGGGSADAREAVREVFLSFASNLAAAEARKDVVKVLAGVDSYVTDALEAARKG